MRTVRKISSKEENFRLEDFYKTESSQGFLVKRDSIKPEPEGTIVLLAFRVVGYDPDCDGSLMARLENIRFDNLQETGWTESCVGLWSDTSLVISKKELKELYEKAVKNNQEGENEDEESVTLS